MHTKIVKSTLLLFLVPLLLHAQTSGQLAIDFVGEQTNGFQGNLTLGWSFEVLQPIKVEALGFFDHFQTDEDGLTFDHQVRIWTDNLEPVLLVAATIGNDGWSADSVASNGRWLFSDIKPVVLPPGNYVIGADDPGCSELQCDRFRLVTVQFTIPQIVFGNARSAAVPGPPMSSQPQLNGGYFGPNMVVSPLVLGDLNEDAMVDLLDVAPFVDLIVSGDYIAEADINFDGVVDLLDVGQFVDLLTGN